MVKDSPFGDYFDDDEENPDKTLFRPTLKAKIQPQGFSPIIASGIPDELPDVANNPLTSCAWSLLTMVAQLRQTQAHPNIDSLHQSIINEIKLFEAKIHKHGVSAEQHQAARYVLCALLDETILNTPWGYNSVWATQSLLITFHKEAWGGEKFFLILKHCLQQAKEQRNLLELLYFCLCLGFEGKYRIQDHGFSQLEEIRENVYRVIQQLRGDADKELSIHWRGEDNVQHPLIEFVPLWKIAVISTLLLLVIFLGFWYLINADADAAKNKLANLHQDKIAQENTSKPPAIIDKPDKLTAFLDPEVKAGQVTIEQRNEKTIIRIMSKGFFASGSEQVATHYLPLLNKITQAMSDITKRITVVGHTDNSPIYSKRFPSNWELSRARARTVAESLMTNPKLKASVDYEGRADSQPMVANDTPEHKAMNRRVEIIF